MCESGKKAEELQVVIHGLRRFRWRVWLAAVIVKAAGWVAPVRLVVSVPCCGRCEPGEVEVGGWRATVHATGVCLSREGEALCLEGQQDFLEFRAVLSAAAERAGWTPEGRP